MDGSQRRKGGIVVGEEFRNVEGEVGARMEAWKELVHGGSVVGGPAVPPDQMSPRTHGPRTSCPARHLVLGLDVPSQDFVEALGPRRECNGVSTWKCWCHHGEMELTCTTTMQLSVVIQPVLLRTIAALFDTSASSTFPRRMECSTMHAEGSASKI